MPEISNCPKCGAKAFVEHFTVDGFDMGWGAGCPRYRHWDGIHDTTPATPECDTYSVFNCMTRPDAISLWNRRCERLRKKLGDSE